MASFKPTQLPSEREHTIEVSLVIPTCSISCCFPCLVDIHDDWCAYGLLNHTYTCPFLIYSVVIVAGATPLSLEVSSHSLSSSELSLLVLNSLFTNPLLSFLLLLYTSFFPKMHYKGQMKSMQRILKRNKLKELSNSTLFYSIK